MQPVFTCTGQSQPLALFYIGHPYYGQLSAVKTVYLPTSIAGLGVQLTGVLS